MTLKEFFRRLFGYTSKKLHCNECFYDWTAVYPISREKHQCCPKCGSKNWREKK